MPQRTFFQSLLCSSEAAENHAMDWHNPDVRWPQNKTRCMEGLEVWYVVSADGHPHRHRVSHWPRVCDRYSSCFFSYSDPPFT